MSKVIPFQLKPNTRVVGFVMRKGQARITTFLSPALRVIREPGKLPRVEFVTPPNGLAS